MHCGRLHPGFPTTSESTNLLDNAERRAVFRYVLCNKQHNKLIGGSSTPRIAALSALILAVLLAP